MAGQLEDGLAINGLVLEHGLSPEAPGGGHHLLPLQQPLVPRHRQRCPASGILNATQPSLATRGGYPPPSGIKPLGRPAGVVSRGRYRAAASSPAPSNTGLGRVQITLAHRRWAGLRLCASSWLSFSQQAFTPILIAI